MGAIIATVVIAVILTYLVLTKKLDKGITKVEQKHLGVISNYLRDETAFYL